METRYKILIGGVIWVVLVLFVMRNVALQQKRGYQQMAEINSAQRAMEGVPAKWNEKVAQDVVRNRTRHLDEALRCLKKNKLEDAETAHALAEDVVAEYLYSYSRKEIVPGKTLRRWYDDQEKEYKKEYERCRIGFYRK